MSWYGAYYKQQAKKVEEKMKGWTKWYIECML